MVNAEREVIGVIQWHACIAAHDRPSRFAARKGSTKSVECSAPLDLQHTGSARQMSKTATHRYSNLSRGIADNSFLERPRAGGP